MEVGAMASLHGIDAATDHENASKALKMCREKFEGRKLATGHSIIVESAPAIPRLELKQKGDIPIVSLAVTDHRCAGPVTLFAVRSCGGEFEIRNVGDDRIQINPVNGLDALREAIESLLEHVGPKQVAEAIADYNRHKF
jgi:hypothetical protein